MPGYVFTLLSKVRKGESVVGIALCRNSAQPGKTLLVVFVGIVFSGAAGYAQMRCPADTRPGDLATQFSIAGGSVKMPAGAFLLVRKKNELGAIRLLSIDPTSTEWFGKSVYESYFSR